ncbi:peroxiredoxin family protein [Salibacter halophilus]|uniref:TlpA family protein disulfide reductase n=1 Tax=Salibacter halophilus TaxID=1803916 RepID=A0A6N6MAP3_9FLAO|nr:TlpA disulfide reductase family protein [Salibacter halophilus]KAB1066251.1 TlpA family protein disulfide reductase [Salibacter halophilus]
MKPTAYLLLTALFSVVACSFVNKDAAKTQQSEPVRVSTTPPDLSSQSEPEVGTDVGDLAPEINLPTPDGKEIALSDLRGKMVLIDFWASWCGPCRRENPNLVKAYEKYKDAEYENADGFTIYSVSLDKNKSSWEKAIEQDNLSWKYHVSDLNFWSSKPVSEYGVRAIPTNFLINEDGIIVAKDLRGALLHRTMDEYVTSF